MKAARIPFDSIIVGTRMRRDYGEVQELADSIQENGLIQPVVVDKNLNLVAGGRRMAAIAKLGWKDVPVVLAEGCGNETDLRRMELEENIRRKQMDWKEHCLCVAEIHRLYAQEGAMHGERWSQKATGELLGVAVGNINYCLMISKELNDPNSIVRHAESMSDALRLVTRRAEDEANRALASIGSTQTASATGGADISVPIVQTTVQQQADAVAGRVVVPDLEAPLTQKKPLPIAISQMWFCSDALEVMESVLQPESMDGILSDPPYGIDMDNLQQKGTGMDIYRVQATHDVKQNRQMFPRMLNGMFHVLKPNSFAVIFCDQAQWEYLIQCAEEAGFTYQRWPLTWVKTHPCLNQSAQYNFTKATEIAMVLKKGSPTLIAPQNVNYWIGDNSESKALHKGHPFAKPFSLWKWILSACWVRGSKILDPYAGVGSSIRTMINCGYIPYAVEIEETHFNEMKNQCTEFYKLMLSRQYDVTFI